MTYCISSALKRYDSGTATSPALRAAWMTAMHLERVRAAPDDAVALLRTERPQPVRDLVHELVELGERGDRRPGAVARVDDHRVLVGRAVGVQLQDVGHLAHACAPDRAAYRRATAPVAYCRVPCGRAVTMGANPLSSGPEDRMISIVMPAYNEAAMLEASVRDVVDGLRALRPDRSRCTSWRTARPTARRTIAARLAEQIPEVTTHSMRARRLRRGDPHRAARGRRARSA